MPYSLKQSTESRIVTKESNFSKLSETIKKGEREEGGGGCELGRREKKKMKFIREKKRKLFPIL